MNKEAPNFLAGFDVNEYPYLPEDLTVPDVGEAGWHETDDGHLLPWQVIGDLAGANSVALVNHGGPGGSIEYGHIAPLLGIEGLVVFAYNQRLTGMGSVPSEFTKKAIDPLETHTPELLVADIEDMRTHILGNRVIESVGGSWGSTLSLLHAEQNPEAVNSLLLWGVTLGRNHESFDRYAAHGELALSRPQEYQRFINLVPDHVHEELKQNPLAIVEYYNEKMNPKSKDYNEEYAKDLAIAFGLLHLSAANPEVFGNLVDKTTKELFELAELLGFSPLQFARLAMKYFAEDFPRTCENGAEGAIIANLASLNGKDLTIVSGSADAVTLTGISEDLYAAASKPLTGISAKLVVVDGGLHDKSDPAIQIALRKEAQVAYRIR